MTDRNLNDISDSMSFNFCIWKMLGAPRTGSRGGLIFYRKEV